MRTFLLLCGILLSLFGGLVLLNAFTKLMTITVIELYGTLLLTALIFVGAFICFGADGIMGRLDKQTKLTDRILAHQVAILEGHKRHLESLGINSDRDEDLIGK